MSTDQLRAVFTADVVEQLARVRDRSQLLDLRLRVLTARGDAGGYSAAWHRAKRAAWETYLGAALAAGMFDPPHDADLRARLTSADDDLFRGAMAECMATWVLLAKFGFRVSPRPRGRGTRELDLLLACPPNDIRSEVKAPYRPLPQGPWHGDDSDLLTAALKSANEQFDAGLPNVLIVVPELRISVSQDRGQLLRAFFGQPVMQFPVDMRTGSAVGPVENVFSPDGALLNRRDRRGRPFKLDGSPPYTRVGAILCIEEEMRLSNPVFVDHKLLVAHNPYAVCPISESLWRDVPQFVPRDDEMVWTDGAPPF